MIGKVNIHSENLKNINSNSLNDVQIKELSKKIETLFLSELLKIMLSDTSFGKEKTMSTYMTVLIPEIAGMMSERGVGIGKFLTENPNFINTLSKHGKIELIPSKPEEKLQNEQIINKDITLPKKISLPVKGVITSQFGLRLDPIDGKRRHHNGIDIAVPEGTPVRPVLSGKVIYSGYSKGYGNCVIVEHEDGIQTLYAHNSKNLVKTGDTVTPEMVIAFSGSTGRTTGPHLHFEVRKDGRAVNPLAMINNFEKSPII
ncbi:peptidase M23 [Thermodesulfovibrio sp. N1]|uniref:M23 family metallopeptidase n=1 Tax=Thermodesulfovibrio sp. N1 TaxID=1871110 RepID=UPI00083B66AE|nr:M23 family metallopeptidase [Thermodesulfovibrio sp. N1]ODA44180.1 peptidase M23 [Thermodesulfovibrio sp. N1]